jgi:ubiquinone/menaquinone biosynthesis C-methylase UbiE
MTVPQIQQGNADPATVAGFGEEWAEYDQSTASPAELRAIWEAYFRVFPWESLPPGAQGFDLGCGSGRWARFVAPRVGRLHCVDASEQALGVARRNLGGLANCAFHHASVDAIPLPDASMDFGYSLGVLHHVPDTAAGIRSCVAKLKRGAPFLLYLYYAFDNRPAWFRGLWRASDRVRARVSRLPLRARVRVTRAIAAGVYWPLARTARLLERAGMNVDAFPLAAYRGRSLYTMQTDALDRFGTRLEQRFTRAEMEGMMRAAGLTDIRFNPGEAFWTAVGVRA